MANKIDLTIGNVVELTALNDVRFKLFKSSLEVKLAKGDSIVIPTEGAADRYYYLDLEARIAVTAELKDAE